jgi:hypothetical protein
VTTVGDEMGVTTPSSRFQLTVRSLKRSFGFRKKDKTITYWSVRLNERNDCRESLDELRNYSLHKGLKPRVSRTLEFEDGARGFEGLEQIDATVVKLT